MVCEKAATTYTVFCDNGKKYGQIDTYGRSDRKLSEKLANLLSLIEIQRGS